MFISKKEISLLLGISYSTIYRWCISGKLPMPIKLGENKTVWIKSEIFSFINKLKTESRGFGSMKGGN